MPPSTASYVICTTPRSGSTLLCKLLEATNIAGRPGSHFHTPSFERWLAVYDLDEADFGSRRAALDAVVNAAIARGKGGASIFGLRMQRGSFAYFMEQLALVASGQMADVARIEAVFGPTFFIHLTRPDRLGQAISLVRAEQSGLWHRRADGTELERAAPPKESQYDAAAIAHQIEKLTALDDAWERWFDQQGLQPLRISYDALSDDPQRVLADVLSALQLDPEKAKHVAPPTAKLADAHSREWRELFEAERH